MCLLQHSYGKSPRLFRKQWEGRGSLSTCSFVLSLFLVSPLPLYGELSSLLGPMQTRAVATSWCLFKAIQMTEELAWTNSTVGFCFKEVDIL